MKRESWHVIVQDGESPADQEAEVVTLERVHAEPGGTIETTAGVRVTFVEPAESRDLAAA